MSEYFIVLLLVFTPTLLLSLHPRSHVRGKIKHMITAIVISAVPFILWDLWAYSRGHWGFNYDYIWNFNIAGLPLEEILFFLVVPYSSLYAWLVIKEYTSWDDLIKRITNES